MLQITCIVRILVVCSILSTGSGFGFVNLTLPGQHPDPEAVVRDVHRKVNGSITRRHLLDEQDSNCLTGNPIDDCWRCDPDWDKNRQRLADCGIGFGQYALGGKGGQFYVVTDSSDHDAVNPAPGTLRYAVIQSEPLWIIFASNMVIHLSQELIFNSYKTLDGRGADVHITGGGCITLQYISNVIITSIHVHHCYQSGNTMVRSSPTHYGYRTLSDGDGISIFGSKDLWIDHCTLSHCKDGLIDIIMGSTGITVSNNHFSHHNEVMLLGHSDAYEPDSGMQVTIAFNHFGPKLIQRMPRCRKGYIHVVNNDFTQWEMYAIGGSGNPTINSQGNRYIAPYDRNAKEVIILHFLLYTSFGEELEVKYEKAFSIEPKSASYIDQLVMNAGVLGDRRNGLGKWTAGPDDKTGIDSNDYDNGGDFDGTTPSMASPASYLVFLFLSFTFYFLYHS
ncbi:hypothetical protein KSS87_003875 [Heliosperma pusillum]|nr:hypothetical protein KSS87_003875 [Heliosperma pusillum]